MTPLIGYVFKLCRNVCLYISLVANVSLTSSNYIAYAIQYMANLVIILKQIIVRINCQHKLKIREN